MAAPDPTPPGLPARDAEAIKRSYGFVLSISIGAWCVLALVVGALGGRDGGGIGKAALGIICFTGLALLCWVLFLRGLRRRELERLEPQRPTGYDPRSR